MGATQKKIFWIAAAGTLAAVLGAIVVGRDVAQGQSKSSHTWTYVWTAPPTGTPVSYYQAQVVANGRDTTVFDRIAETRLAIPVELGKDYMVRVRAFDEADRPGPYSLWSHMETVEEDPPTNTSGSGSG